MDLQSIYGAARNSAKELKTFLIGDMGELNKANHPMAYCALSLLELVGAVGILSAGDTSANMDYLAMALGIDGALRALDFGEKNMGIIGMAREFLDMSRYVFFRT